VSNQIAFSPHIPPEWHELTVRNVRMQHAALDLQIHRDDGHIALTVTNRGRPASFVFDPELPLGARLLGSECGNRRVANSMERNAQDQHVRLAFTMPQGTTHCVIRFQGGVELISPHLVPLLGSSSTGIKITSIELSDKSLSVEADVNDAGAASFEIVTPWKSASAEGGTIHQIGSDLYQVDLDRAGTASDSFGYSHRRAVVRFAAK
jgi:hypothetical protein